MLNKFFFVYTIRNFVYNDFFLSCRCSFNISFRSNNDTSFTSFKCIFYTSITINNTSRWKIRCFDVLHQFLDSNIVIIYVCVCSINNFVQVVWSHIGSHTNCNTRCSIEQKIWNTSWQNGWFGQRVVKVFCKIYRFFIQIYQHIFCNFTQTSLCVTHSSRSVAIN